MTSRFSLIALLAFSLVGCDRGPSVEQPPTPRAETPSAMAAPAAPSAMSAPSATAPTAAAPAAAAPAAAGTFPDPSVGGIGWEAPERFTRRAPGSQMRFAEYTVSGEAGEAMMTVSHFPGMGGSVQRNVDRWVGQFSRPDGSNIRDHATIEASKVGEIDVTVVDVSGTFESSMPMGSRAGPQTGQRLLGAIVSAPEGPVFFKLLGPEATLEEARADFDQLLRSVR